MFLSFIFEFCHEGKRFPDEIVLSYAEADVDFL